MYNVICVYLVEDISGELAMNDGDSLDFSINELPTKLDEKAKIIIEKHFI